MAATGLHSESAAIRNSRNTPKPSGFSKTKKVRFIAETDFQINMAAAGFTFRERSDSELPEYRAIGIS